MATVSPARESVCSCEQICSGAHGRGEGFSGVIRGWRSCRSADEIPMQNRVLYRIVRNVEVTSTAGSLCEYMVHECAKTYVCVLYGSPRAPLLAPWLGELERTSLVTT